jgi:hypothetical protein
MLDKRYHYNKQIAVCEEDLEYVRSLKVGKLGKKSVAGILSFIITYYQERHK